MDIFQRIETILNPIEEPIFFELGAGIGDTTKKFYDLLAKGGKVVKYHAFEPIDKLFKQLQKNYPMLLESVNLLNKGIADFTGNNKFYMVKKDGKGASEDECLFKSSLKKPNKEHESFINTRCTITTTYTDTLDLYCEIEDVPHIDFIWMDVNGAEDDVIEGGKFILKRTKYICLKNYTSEDIVYNRQLSVDELLDLLINFDIVDKINGYVILKNNKYN